MQKCADFVQAFVLGFDTQDAIALLRLDDLYVECFEVKDVKTLKGSTCPGVSAASLARAGRRALRSNATRTGIVVTDTHQDLGQLSEHQGREDAICASFWIPAGKGVFAHEGV